MVGSSVMGRNFSSQMRRVQFGVGICRMTISASSRREEHVAPVHRALVHLAKVNSREVDLEGALITERLQTDVALHALLAGGGRHERHSEVVAEFLLHLLVHVFAGRYGEGAGWGTSALSLALRVPPLPATAPTSRV